MPDADGNAEPHLADIRGQFGGPFRLAEEGNYSSVAKSSGITFLRSMVLDVQALAVDIMLIRKACQPSDDKKH